VENVQVKRQSVDDNQQRLLEDDMNLNRILFLVASFTILVGIWGFYDRFANGHINANYGSYMTWGLWVAVYLFFTGLSAGAFVMASLDFLFKIPLFKGLGRVMLWAGLISLGAGLVSIWLDLGHLDRIWEVYLRPNWLSVMTQITWGYTIFGAIQIAALYLGVRDPDNGWLKVLMISGLPLALFVSGGTGALLGVQAAQLFWHVGLFPAQFPVFSLASGVALMLAIIGLFGSEDDPRRPQQLWVLAITTVTLQGIKLYFLWADFSQSVYTGVPANVLAVEEVMFGQYWWAFWILQLGIGTVIPTIVLVQPRLAKHNSWAGWMGVLVMFGFVVARANIVFPALAIPEIEELAQAFVDPRLQFNYFPSAMEWAVTAGIVGATILAFLIGIERLPLLKGYFMQTPSKQTELTYTPKTEAA
jgi:protein NrfD